jgi:hypothetical protein
MNMKFRFAVATVFAFVASIANSAPIEPGQIEVVDGDTIRVGSETFRLVGFDAPETYRAKCPSERELGNRATFRLRQLVAGGGLDPARSLANAKGRRDQKPTACPDELPEIPRFCPSEDERGTRRLCSGVEASGQGLWRRPPESTKIKAVAFHGPQPF